MAIVSIPILGQASGKMSDVEFLRINGQNIIRSSKLKRYKPTPQVSLDNQAKLRLLCQGCSSIIPLINKSYKSKKRIWSKFNTWIHDHYEYFHQEDMRTLVLDEPENLRFANYNQNSQATVYDINLMKTSFECSLSLVPSLGPDNLIFYGIYAFNGMMFSGLYACEVISSLPLRIQSYGDPLTVPARQSDAYLLIYDFVNDIYYDSIYLGRYEL